jgi:uncharacterized protein
VSDAAHPSDDTDALTAGFWEAARNGVLVRPVCRDCGLNFFSPQIACPRCLSENWGWERSSGRGTVYSATVVHRKPYPGLEAPYQLAIIDLDEGWSMLANLDGDPGDPPAIGTAVEVRWRRVEDGSAIPLFGVVEGHGNDQGAA